LQRDFLPESALGHNLRLVLVLVEAGVLFFVARSVVLFVRDDSHVVDAASSAVVLFPPRVELRSERGLVRLVLQSVRWELRCDEARSAFESASFGSVGVSVVPLAVVRVWSERRT
jgi:hypothetical protein